ncbi:MAG: hypothetical protein Q7R33_00800 [Nitrosarchaeum sp.]|nr:hypothetical protein [Nitrosarchaeum sp.]
MKVKTEKLLQIREDGTIPIITGDFKVKYTESEINTNWLLNKLLGTKNLQITKISHEDVLKFLVILDQTRLEMPDGTDSLVWLKKRIGKRYEQSLTQRGQSWEDISSRYQFILQQIDLILALRTINQT